MSEPLRVLRPGEAVALIDLIGSGPAELALALRSTTATPDLVALLVGESGRVRSDDDLVFYNNPASADGGVRYLGSNAGTEWLRVCPGELDADVARVIVGCAGGVLDQSGEGSLAFRVADPAGGPLAEASFPAEPGHRAVILFEVYRRNGEWRCRFLAQGYSGGLAALVTEYGVSVDDPGAEAASSAPPAVRGGAHAAPEVTVAAPPAVSATVAAPPAPPPTGSADVQWAPTETARSKGLFTSRKRAQLQAQNAELERLLATSGALDNAAMEAERRRLAGEVAALAGEAERRRSDLQDLENRLAQVRASIAVAEGDAELTEVGIYSYRHRLDDAIAYKGRIDSLRERIKDVAKRGAAVTGDTGWTVNGSAAQGRKMVNEFSKLMLRAYNADADHAVRTMRAYKLDSALTRLDTTRSTIARLGATMRIQIADEYHWLRKQELELTADYLSKLEEEKERQRRLREEQREQQRADAEYAREQERLERDRQKYAEALAQLVARGETAKAEELRSQLSRVDDALAGLIERRSNMRLGHVYVISNIGAFGERMVKIGMTRRMVPEDRIRELGDASVPFRFDKHALIFSEDAVALETALHQRFAAQRVNRVNAHREFFYVTPAEVRQALAELGTQYLVEYTEQIEAPEWRQSGGPDRSLLPT